ncbi:MAG: SPFH domain-containing protein [Planctomycetaceae bacterium]
MSAVIGLLKFVSMPTILAADPLSDGTAWLLPRVGIPFAGLLFVAWLVLRYIPNDAVGVIEKLWSLSGSVPEGQIMAAGTEAGFHSDLLRGGIHFGYWRWQYVIHKIPLVTIPQGKIGYVYARDGEPLPPSQTLARVVTSNHFQDARAFLGERGPDTRGQRGRQRAILREGVYAINPALFIVITEATVFSLRNLQSVQERATIASWQAELNEIDAFDPVVVGGAIKMPDPANPDQTIVVDSIGIVTVHDGLSLLPGEIIAPTVGATPTDPHYHNNFQVPEEFLAAGGQRGRQHAVLTDGTYFINRWFATVRMIPKTIVPIGHVGVVVSYYGQQGRDLSGTAFRHGERVEEGERGVWEKALGPGKYAFNTYAGSIVLVPTTNFVLHWITGKSESHRYDEGLKSIDLVTKDAYEPMLPLSVVVHIDYQKAPSVIQRFGDVKKLITQTLDPMLSAYFRDVAHRRTMLELLQQRDAIQVEAREELRSRFGQFDMECVDVLIGKPDTASGGGSIETLLDQLRMRQLSVEQLETFDRQRAAADKQRALNEAQAQAAMQAKLTQARVQIQIAESEAEADLARARKNAEKTIVAADADVAQSKRRAEQTIVAADAELAQSRRRAEQTVVLAEAESQQRILVGKGEAQQVMQVGLSQAAVLLKKISSYGDPRLYALSLVSEQLAHSAQPLVPERLFVSGGDSASTGGQAGQGLMGLLLSLLVAEKSGFEMSSSTELDQLKQFSDRLAQEAMQTMTPTTSTENESVLT